MMPHVDYRFYWGLSMPNLTPTTTISALQEASLTDRIRAFIAEYLRMDFDYIRADVHLHDDLGLDYLDVFELAIQLEKAFAREDTFDDADEVEFVGDLIFHIEQGLKRMRR
jgi:acyl carrier protein